MENKPSLIPLANMARRLRVPVKWLRAEALAGRIPCLDAAGRLLFNPEVVEAALASRARGESPSEDITRPATVSIAPMDDDAGKKDQRIRDLAGGNQDADRWSGLPLCGRGETGAR